eukprot:gene12603-21082_t
MAETVNPNTNTTMLCQCIGVPKDGAHGGHVGGGPYAGPLKFDF